MIEIEASGSYDGDVCAITKDRLTIRGVNGRPHIDAAGKSSGGKAIWVVQGSDTRIYNVELSGCSVPDKNGAGIRQEGRNLVVDGSYFHDNENGILTGADAQSSITIVRSEFARNGAGDGQSHNMYIGEVAQFTLQESYSHLGKVGHLVKSRALRNVIRYNRLTDETGTASYEIDLPQGGESIVVGNVLQKSADAGNGGFISFAREGKRNAKTGLWVVNNTFVNQRSAGTFVAVAKDVQTVLLRNNIFAGPGTPTDLAGAVGEANFAGDPKFTDAARYDFTLLAGSPAIDRAADPGSGAGERLDPVCQYVDTARASSRLESGLIDQGAFEYGNRGNAACGESDEWPSLPDPADAGVPHDASSALDARVADASATLDGDARAGGAEPGDVAARGPTQKSDGGCQGAGVGAQLWSVVGALLWTLRRRRCAGRCPPSRSHRRPRMNHGARAR